MQQRAAAALASLASICPALTRTVMVQTTMATAVVVVVVVVSCSAARR